MSAQSEQHQQRPILRSFNFDSHPNGCEAKHCSYLVHLWTLCMKMPQWTEHHRSWPIYCVANNVSATQAASECTISSGPSSAHFSQTLNTLELIGTLCLFRSNIKSKAVWTCFSPQGEPRQPQMTRGSFSAQQTLPTPQNPYLFSEKGSKFTIERDTTHSIFHLWVPGLFFVRQYYWTSWKAITIYKLTEWFLNIPCLVAFAVNLCKIL